MANQQRTHGTMDARTGPENTDAARTSAAPTAVAAVEDRVCAGVRVHPGSRRPTRRRRRRGAILVLFALLAIVLIGMVALSVDTGYIYVTRREAQVAADSAALAAAAYVPTSTAQATAAAIEYAGYNQVAGTLVTAASVDVEFGTWAPSLGVFTPTISASNAVRVTVRRDATHAGPVPLFFGRVLNKSSFNVARSSIALTTPRDIVFVVDISGSLNDDTEPCWATDLVNAAYPTVGTALARQIYLDLGFGTFPGSTQFVGQGLTGVTDNDFNYALMTRNGGPLTQSGVEPAYRITSTTETEASRKTKAYRWIIDKQIQVLMPLARPYPDSTNATSFAYWSNYIDYLRSPNWVNSATSMGGPRPSYPVFVPAGSVTAISDNQLGNPSRTLANPTSSQQVLGFRNDLGYRTYVQFMLDFNRHVTFGVNSQISTLSPNCVYHNESIDGVSFSFPPGEQPMHAIRRALISTLNLIKSRNSNVGDSNQRDRVGLLLIDDTVKTSLDAALTTNYDSVRNLCRTIQAKFDASSSTAMDTNISFAAAQLQPSAQGRANARKILVIISDFNVTTSTATPSAIDNYQLLYPYPEYGWFHNFPPPQGVTDARYEPDSATRYGRNGALMAAHQGYGASVETYAVKVGFASNKAMMDALADFGGTANSANEAPSITNDPALYESRIRAVLADIIDNPRGRLVQ